MINILKEQTDKVFQKEEYYFIAFVNGVLNTNILNLPETGIKFYSDSEDIMQIIEITDSLDKALKIYYANSKNSQHNTVIQIKQKPGTKISLHEEFIQYEELEHVINHLTKIELDNNAYCQHFKKHNLTNEAKLSYSAEVICKTNAQYENYMVNVGCKSYKNNIQCQLQGMHAAFLIYAVAIGQKQQYHKLELNVQHKANYTKTIQYYNQILEDKSQGSFYSKIAIPENLHNLEAHQFNKNLLLNETAQAFTEPILDIRSDDVKCSHGATIGNIDANAVNYLKSRGINSIEAQKLIMEGFSKSVFEHKTLRKKDYQMLINQIANYIK